MEVVVTTRAIRRAKLQSSRHHQQTNTQLLQAGCPSCCATNNVRALKGKKMTTICLLIKTLSLWQTMTEVRNKSVHIHLLQQSQIQKLYQYSLQLKILQNNKISTYKWIFLRRKSIHFNGFLFCMEEIMKWHCSSKCNVENLHIQECKMTCLCLYVIHSFLHCLTCSYQIWHDYPTRGEVAVHRFDHRTSTYRHATPER